MKVLLACCILLTGLNQSDNFLVIDKEYKTDPYHAPMFTSEMYLKGFFPVYADQKDALTAAVVQTARAVDRGIACNEVDTLLLGKMQLVWIASCQLDKKLNVSIATQVGENIYYHYLLKNEDASRQSQRKLLAFAEYLDAVK